MKRLYTYLFLTIGIMSLVAQVRAMGHNQQQPMQDEGQAAAQPGQGQAMQVEQQTHAGQIRRAEEDIGAAASSPKRQRTEAKEKKEMQEGGGAAQQQQAILFNALFPQAKSLPDELWQEVFDFNPEDFPSELRIVTKFASENAQLTFLDADGPIALMQDNAGNIYIANLNVQVINNESVLKQVTRIATNDSGSFVTAALLAATPASMLVAVGRANGQVTVHRITNQAAGGMFQLDGVIQSLSFNPSLNKLGVTTGDDKGYIIDINNLSVHSLPFSNEYKDQTDPDAHTAIRFAPTVQKAITVNQGENIEEWNIQDMQNLSKIGGIDIEGKASWAGYINDTHILINYVDGRAGIFDLTARQETHLVQDAYNARLNARRDRLVVVGANNRVRVVDLQGKELGFLDVAQPVRSVWFQPAGPNKEFVLIRTDNALYVCLMSHEYSLDQKVLLYALDQQKRENQKINQEGNSINFAQMAKKLSVAEALLENAFATFSPDMQRYLIQTYKITDAPGVNQQAQQQQAMAGAASSQQSQQAAASSASSSSYSPYERAQKQ